MKSLFFTICFVAAFVCNAQNEKMAVQLQSKSWFVTGTVGDNNPMIFRTTTGKIPSEWEARFSSTGRMSSCAVTKKDEVDMFGNAVKSGTFWCDSMYVYSVKNDVVSIMKYDKTFHYKMKPLPDSQGIELAPAPKDDSK